MDNQQFPQPPQSPQFPQPPQHPFPAPVPPKKNNTVVIIAIIVSVTVIIVAAMMIFGRSKNEPEPTTSPTETKETEATLTMPNLIGDTEESAVKKLEEMGMTVTVNYVPMNSSRKPDRVDDQIPNSGETLKKGESVYLYVPKADPTEKPTVAPTQKPTTAPPTPKPTKAPDPVQWPPKGALLYVTADDFVSLREMPGAQYPEITKIYHGEMMGYLNSRKGPWLYVQYGTHKGYVYEDYVTTRN